MQTYTTYLLYHHLFNLSVGTAWQCFHGLAPSLPVQQQRNALDGISGPWPEALSNICLSVHSLNLNTEHFHYVMKNENESSITRIQAVWWWPECMWRAIHQIVQTPSTAIRNPHRMWSFHCNQSLVRRVLSVLHGLPVRMAGLWLFLTTCDLMVLLHGFHSGSVMQVWVVVVGVFVC